MKFIIIGGGPVGLCAALLLSKSQHEVTVYEGRNEIPNDPEESYPIGVNPRGLSALELIDTDLSFLVREKGKIVEAWQIFGGDRMVANLRSGVVYGTSRGELNLALYECAVRKGIKVHFGQRLSRMNLSKRSLEFETGLKLEAADCFVIAADGVGSRIRRDLSAYLDVETTPWSNEFRVLFSEPGKTSPSLDDKVHYIFNGLDKIF